MGGTIDWKGLEIIGELLGVVDYDIFITELLAIRDHMERIRNAE